MENKQQKLSNNWWQGCVHCVVPVMVVEETITKSQKAQKKHNIVFMQGVPQLHTAADN